MNKLRIIACVICQLLYNIFNVFFAWVIMQITDSLVKGDSSVFVNYLEIAGIGVGCQILFNFLLFFSKLFISVEKTPTSASGE